MNSAQNECLTSMRSKAYSNRIETPNFRLVSGVPPNNALGAGGTHHRTATPLSGRPPSAQREHLCAKPELIGLPFKTDIEPSVGVGSIVPAQCWIIEMSEFGKIRVSTTPDTVYPVGMSYHSYGRWR